MRPYLRPEAHAPDAGGAWAQQELLPSPSPLAGVRRRACAPGDRSTRRRLAEFPCENLAPLPIDDFMRAFFSLANRPPPPGLAAALELARTRETRPRGGRGERQTIDLTGGDDAVVADEGAVEVVHAEAADEAIEVVQERSLDDVLRERAARSGVIALDDDYDDDAQDDDVQPRGVAGDSEDDEVECLGSVAAQGTASPGAGARARTSPRRSPSSESDVLRSPSPFSSSASSSSLSSTPSLADDDEDAHRPRSPWSSLSDAATQERAPLEELPELSPDDLFLRSYLEL